MANDSGDVVTVPLLPVKCEETGNQLNSERSESALNSSTSSCWLWRGLNFAIACFFALAAYVQFNDPDPLLWMFVYGIPACLCLSAAFSPDVQESNIWQSLATADICACLVGAIYLMVTIKPLMEKQSIINPLALEEGREMSGLILIMLWISLCKFVTWYSDRKGNVPVFFWFLIFVLCCSPFALWAYCFHNLDKNKLPGHCKDML